MTMICDFENVYKKVVIEDIGDIYYLPKMAKKTGIDNFEDLFWKWHADNYEQFFNGEIPDEVSDEPCQVEMGGDEYYEIMLNTDGCFVHPNDLDHFYEGNWEDWFTGGPVYEFKNESLNEFLDHYCKVFSLDRNYDDPIETMSNIKEVAILGYYTLMGETLYNHWFSWKIPSKNAHMFRGVDHDNELRHDYIMEKVGIMIC